MALENKLGGPTQTSCSHLQFLRLKGIVSLIVIADINTFHIYFPIIYFIC